MLATRAIRPDDRISFDYASTERRISHPFDCLCRPRACRGRIG